MKYLIILTFIWFFNITADSIPDLTKKADLKALGIGKIIETDRTIIKQIELEEVAEYYIVYIKDKSLHDIAIDKVKKLEFEETKWGPIKIEFIENKPKVTINY